MTIRNFTTVLALAALVAGSAFVTAPVRAQDSSSSSAEASSGGGEGYGAAGYGRPGMAGHLPVRGTAYNDGTR